jgi:outer membrane protein|tara:strand:- start:245 stop:769 length:525 start_codon:yes stop_codon:yes gene_type:complete
MLKRLFIIIFLFLLYFNPSISDDLKIVYVDIDKVLLQSNAGKAITKQLENLNKNNIKKFKEQEKKITSNENDILKKKNVLSEEEFKKKVNNLQIDIKNFKENINSSRVDLDKKRLEATAKILDILNPILSDYSSKNSISLIIQKKNIVIGKTELDITSQILKILNTKIKTVKLN